MPPPTTGLRALADTVLELTRPLVGDRRFPAAELLAGWPDIVGERLAAESEPVRLVLPPRRRSGGTLHVRVASGASAIELQHEAERIVTRIAHYLGSLAVGRLKLVQAPMPARRRGPRLAATAVAGPLVPLPLPEGIENPRLATVLAHLGAHLARRSRPAAILAESPGHCSTADASV
jgi:hypothetical protein